jgi:hypothetical protein
MDGFCNNRTLGSRLYLCRRYAAGCDDIGMGNARVQGDTIEWNCYSAGCEWIWCETCEDWDACQYSEVCGSYPGKLVNYGLINEVITVKERESNN